ncbi:hypothetical protein APHAL10511_006678 [Amanita phalloides]|nr:hypothetical protein APHAL10511_006678 [Amanita phalloides]
MVALASWHSLWELQPIVDLLVALWSRLQVLFANADPYAFQLLSLLLVTLTAIYTQKQVSFCQRSNSQLEGMDYKVQNIYPGAATGLSRRYLLVYGLVMGADWLQGPYLYSLYREQYNFSERLVAVLFITGFVSAGIAAPFVGVWADQYGRKRLCLAFCLTYSFACLCKLVDNYLFLLSGRVFGGISTAILFSTFEAWLISSATSISLPQANLSVIMARATLLNGFVATTAGIISNELVQYTHTFRTPFVLAAVVLVSSWFVIKSIWAENYGENQMPMDDMPLDDMPQTCRIKEVCKALYSEPQLFILGLVQTCFEGSMYIFVFVWVPSLQEISTSPSPLPLGYIFSSFMVSMMLGSLLYTFITNRFLPSPASVKLVTAPSTPAVELPFPPNSYFPLPQANSLSRPGIMPVRVPNPELPLPIPSPRLLPLVLYTRLSSLICLVGGISLGASVLFSSVYSRCWSFCVFEACVGMYYPVQGMLRSILIPDEHRATMSSLFRIPLNAFVAVSLLTGVSSARQTVLIACSLVLGLSSVIMLLSSMKAAHLANTHNRLPLF